MKITFIVSSYDRPAMLRLMLSCLQVQTEKDWECIIANNNPYPAQNSEQQWVISQFNDPRFIYKNPKLKDAYESIWALAPESRGDWLCFPSDDCYYVPQFAERMWKLVTSNPAFDFVYCDMIYDPRPSEGRDWYAVVNTSPNQGAIDKAGFLVRKSLFLKVGWRNVEGQSALLQGSRDGMLAEDLARRGTPMVKAKGIMLVHN
jgi:glycosyltransferase involved in cell wall biosynthesis